MNVVGHEDIMADGDAAIICTVAEANECLVNGGGCEDGGAVVSVEGDEVKGTCVVEKNGHRGGGNTWRESRPTAPGWNSTSSHPCMLHPQGYSTKPAAGPVQAPRIPPTLTNRQQPKPFSYSYYTSNDNNAEVCRNGVTESRQGKSIYFCVGPEPRARAPRPQQSHARSPAFQCSAAGEGTRASSRCSQLTQPHFRGSVARRAKNFPKKLLLAPPVRGVLSSHRNREKGFRIEHSRTV